MANKKNLSAFRQLSLSCDGPKIQQKILKKQFSEDVPDPREWSNRGIGIKISLDNKSIPIRKAWAENASCKSFADEAVTVNKCKESRRSSSGKLSRQTSLEKESILHSKQELAERLRHTLKDRGDEKFNLRIFLARDSKDSEEDDCYSREKQASPSFEKPGDEPKLITPLVARSNDKNPFRIRKPIRSSTISNDSYSSYPPSSKQNTFESSTVVVVPLVSENDDLSTYGKETSVDSEEQKKQNLADVKVVDAVIIRPVSAASKRERFQKRINSAFTSTVKEAPKQRRPLVRSSSAPCKPNNGRSKLNGPKNKLKVTRRFVQAKAASIDDEEVGDIDDKSPKSKKELGCDIVTMVSLVSPAGSDVEEAVEPEIEKCKNASKKDNANVQEENCIPRIMSLRKAAKSVSFQQSSIHAIRSFSASFPARRGSVASALMLGNHLRPTGHGPKVQEKRSTNSTVPDDNERVPKRRLVRSNTEEPKTVSSDKPIETKLVNEKQPIQNTELEGALQDNEDPIAEISMETKPLPIATENPPPENDKEELKSAKEKQCWNMYCKMTEKGINVSFDTILRGMLTPTEYRLSKKHLDAVSNIESGGN